MRHMLWIVAAAALALAGCSGSGTPEAPTFASASTLAAKVGCTNLRPHSGVMYEKDGANCDIGSAREVEVVIFADGSARDQWVQVAKQVGFGSNIVEGDTWVVSCPDPATASAVVKATGGKEA